MRISMLVSNDLASDQRVLKMCHSLLGWGHQVTLTGRLRKNSPQLPILPFKTNRLRLPFETGVLFYSFLQIRLFFHLLGNRQDMIHANDLDTLLPAWIVSKIKRIPLVYDTHEYFTGVPELNKRPIVKMVWKLIESSIFPRLNKVITVNDSIARLYELDYNHKAKVVRNIPSISTPIRKVSRKDLDLPEDKFILILQGNGINVDRGAEEAVEMMKYLQDCLLLVIGAGDVIPKLKKDIQKNSQENIVRFYPRLPYDEMMKYTSVSDIGLTLDKDSNINYRYSLPNKLFDYIRAGIPVLATDLPEVRKIIDESACGVIINTHRPEEMAEIVTALKDNPQQMQLLRTKSQQAASGYSWEKETENIRDWYL